MAAGVPGRLGAFGLTPAKEPGAGHHSHFVEALPDRAYVRGYFQSPHYFTAVQQQVRDEVLTTCAECSRRRALLYADDLSSDPHSVSVHVRRGDYITDSTAAAKHGLLSPAYYDQARDLLDGLGHTRRIWFSDDLDWVKENLAAP